MVGIGNAVVENYHWFLLALAPESGYLDDGLVLERVAHTAFDNQLLDASLGDQSVDLGRLDADQLGELGGTGTGVSFDNR
jgi:hypothetical protein